MGVAALKDNTTGYSNVVMGMNAGISNVPGKENVCFGYIAGGASTGHDNAFLGGAGYYSTGSLNTFIGKDAGENMTYWWSKNVIIGKYTGNNGGLDLRTVDNQIILSDGDGNAFSLNRMNLFVQECTPESLATALVHVNFRQCPQVKKIIPLQKYSQDATHGLTELLKL